MCRLRAPIRALEGARLALDRFAAQGTVGRKIVSITEKTDELFDLNLICILC